jgi:hypothetical protein
MTVTRSEGNLVLEFDKRPALDVWREVNDGAVTVPNTGEASALAIGVTPESGAPADGRLILAVMLLDDERGGVVMPRAIPAGTKVTLHHRTVEDVLGGARRLGEDLRGLLSGRRPRAALAFECGARTKPFLGEEATLRENLDLQRAVAPDAAWVGAMVWGEVFPVAEGVGVHNYTYPVAVLSA